MPTASLHIAVLNLPLFLQAPHHRLPAARELSRSFTAAQAPQKAAPIRRLHFHPFRREVNLCLRSGG